MKEVAERQKMKSLKVMGRNKTRILPANWTARVDHELDNENPEENDADHNDWVEDANNDSVEDEELSETETEPVTDDKIRQLREDEAQ